VNRRGFLVEQVFVGQVVGGLTMCGTIFQSMSATGQAFLSPVPALWRVRSCAGTRTAPERISKASLFSGEASALAPRQLAPQRRQLRLLAGDGVLELLRLALLNHFIQVGVYEADVVVAEHVLPLLGSVTILPRQ
jgi:hypothetical protein